MTAPVIAALVVAILLAAWWDAAEMAGPEAPKMDASAHDYPETEPKGRKE